MIVLMIHAREMKKETVKSTHTMILIAKCAIVVMSANLVLSDTNLVSLKNLTTKERRKTRNRSFKR